MQSTDRKAIELLDASDRTDDQSTKLDRKLEDMKRIEQQHFESVMKQIHSTWACLDSRLTALEQQRGASITVGVPVTIQTGSAIESQPVAHGTPGAYLPTMRGTGGMPRA